jgi:hypothetical protein
MLLITGLVLAQGFDIQVLPGSGWESGQQVQNVGNDLANMTATVYYGGDEYGTTGVTMTDVGVNESVNILAMHWDSPDASFQGAAVVSADQPIVAIVNVTNGEAAGQYQGIGAPATEFGFPLFKNDFGAAHKHTTFYIQNASNTAAMVYATFKDDAAIEYTINSGANVLPGEMWVLDPDNVAGMPTGIKGGLVVTSTVNIAGVVLEHGVTEETILQATKGFSPAEYATELVAPLIKRQFGAKARSTGLQVQNVSDAPVDIYVNYVEAGLSATPGATYRQWALGVAPGASYTFFENLKDGGDNIPTGVLASATVTATGEIAAIVNETYYPTVPTGKRQTQTTYHAIATADATTKVGVPLAKEMMGAAGREKSTGIQVMNVGPSTATVDLAYAFGGTTYTIEDQAIASGASSTFFKVNASMPPSEWAGGIVLPTGGFGGVIVTSDQDIVVIVQETDLRATNPQDNKNYEGFNLAP